MKYLDMVILGKNPIVSLMRNPKIKKFHICPNVIFMSSRGSENKLVGDNLEMLIEI